MTRRELEKLWCETLRADSSGLADYERLASTVTEVYAGDPRFREHLKNRSRRVLETTGVTFDADNFDIAMARGYIADELGFTGWEKLVESVENFSGRPMLFKYAVAALWRGDFSALESAIGRGAFDDKVRAWLDAGYFADEPETYAEMFAAACMLGYERAAADLLDSGVEPYAGMKTGLAGFHYAASSGRLNVIKLLIERKVPMEVKNMYGGTVFDQAIWSAVNEYSPDHAAIVEALIEAGAVVEPGYLEWWEKQNVPTAEEHERIAAALKSHGHT
jgi:hypothetical protein